MKYLCRIPITIFKNKTVNRLKTCCGFKYVQNILYLRINSRQPKYLLVIFVHAARRSYQVPIYVKLCDSLISILS